MVASCTPPTGDLACNPGMCPDQESNWKPFGSQADAQSTEPHQPDVKNNLKGINSGVDEAKNQNSDLEYKEAKPPTQNSRKKKEL